MDKTESSFSAITDLNWTLFLATQAADKNKDGRISFQEFLESFREKTEAMAQAVEEMDDASMSSSASGSLMGLDAHIPGGMFDSNLSPSEKEGRKLNLT